ncbi:MAG TPA: transposase [Trebonia sp.]|nr:transposase [Trebonia sp.]
MPAIRHDALGGPEVLKEESVTRPEPGLSEILVRVRAAGVNPTDWKHRAFQIFLGPPPFTLGWDVSGVVEAAEFGVTIFKSGDEVFGMLPYPHGHGSHAEFVTGPARAFARKPPEIDHVQAGALPLAALTAWQALTLAFHDPQYIDVLHRDHATVETGGVRIAKAMGLRNLPSKTWQVNKGWVLAANIAADLTAWARLLGFRDQDDLKDAEPDTLRHRIWHLPARLIRHARKRILKISPDWPWNDAFLTCHPGAVGAGAHPGTPGTTARRSSEPKRT